MEQLMSLSKIFTERLFRIPDYQRGYAWTEKEVDEFWNDLCRLEINKNHYVGVLTLEPVKSNIYSNWVDDTWLIESKRYVPYYIVDGQQRLTTSIILIHAIIQTMKNKNIPKLNYTGQEEISNKFVFESKNENHSKTYIFGYERDNPSYQCLVNSIFIDQPSTNVIFEETIYTYNLETAKQILIQKLIDLNVEQLEVIYTKITQHFLFNMYIISSDIDVNVTFETMNNRGKPLSHLELLKNRLIYISTLFKESESDKSRLRRDINLCWKDMYYILGKNKEKRLLDDDFLVTHFMLYFCSSVKDKEGKYGRQLKYFYEFGEWQKNYLLNDFFIQQNIINNKLNMTQCFEYIQSLKNYIVKWEYIKNPLESPFNDDIKEYIEKINSLTNNRQVYYYNKVRRRSPEYSCNMVFIMACFQACKRDEDLLKFLKALERYLFTLDFYNDEAFDENDIKLINFNEVVIKLDKGEMVLRGVFEKLDKVYSQIMSSNEINHRAVKYYNRIGFYQQNWLRYFLCEYEVSLMRKSKSSIPKLDRDVYFQNGYKSIEHIYPVNSRNSYWLNLYKEYNTKQRNCLKNSLGNFVAIAGEKNSKLGNLPFPEKKFNSKNTLGYKYGTYSEIELTEYEDWGSNDIYIRGVKLISFLQERWGIKIGQGKKKDKKFFLGIDFL